MIPEEDNFRDQIATADTKGNRLWVYALQPSGRLYRARTFLSVFLLLFLFGAPFLKINGQPLLLFDIIHRRFILFGLSFWPQDFYLFVLVAITLVFFVVLFTAIFGRIFCGWICPQTVFMEMVFRRIEYLIEGSPARQKKLNNGPWNEVKLFKKSLKHSVFFGISFLIGNIFLAYIIGIDPLLKIITEPPSLHPIGLVAMIGFSLIFYGVFAWFREQACVMVCPYGRLQSVLIDSNSIVVAYDHKRGEPRAKFKKIIASASATDVGDCVACNACVAVCPTGIDIRHGTQLECVNCTACIDACNSVMRKVKRPEGLIRYASENSILGGKKFKFTGRIAIYSSLLVILLIVITSLLSGRSDLEATILRTPGALFYEGDNGEIRNLYTVRVINKTFDPIPVEISLLTPSYGQIKMVGNDLLVPADSSLESAFFVDIPAEKIVTRSTLLTIELITSGEVIHRTETSFLGPQRSIEKVSEAEKAGVK